MCKGTLWTWRESHAAHDEKVCALARKVKRDAGKIITLERKIYGVESLFMLRVDTTSNGDTNMHGQHYIPLLVHRLAGSRDRHIACFVLLKQPDNQIHWHPKNDHYRQIVAASPIMIVESGLHCGGQCGSMVVLHGHCGR